MLSIYILLKGILKAQRCSFMLLDFVLPVAATLGLMPIYIAASTTSLTLIRTVASTTGLTPIYTAASAVALPIYIAASSAGHTNLYSSQLCWSYQSIQTLAMLVIPICINASCISLTPIPICMLAMLGIYMLLKGVLKA